MKLTTPTLALLTHFIMVSVVLDARAGDTIFSESFEGAFPGPWTVADSDSEGVEAFWGKVSSGFGGEGTSHGSWKGYCAASGFAGTSLNPEYRPHMRSHMLRVVDLRGSYLAP